MGKEDYENTEQRGTTNLTQCRVERMAQQLQKPEQSTFCRTNKLQGVEKKENEAKVKNEHSKKKQARSTQQQQLELHKCSRSLCSTL